MLLFRWGYCWKECLFWKAIIIFKGSTKDRKTLYHLYRTEKKKKWILHFVMFSFQCQVLIIQSWYIRCVRFVEHKHNIRSINKTIPENCLQLCSLWIIFNPNLIIHIFLKLMYEIVFFFLNYYPSTVTVLLRRSPTPYSKHNSTHLCKLHYENRK